MYALTDSLNSGVKSSAVRDRRLHAAARALRCSSSASERVGARQLALHDRDFVPPGVRHQLHVLQYQS